MKDFFINRTENTTSISPYIVFINPANAIFHQSNWYIRETVVPPKL